MNSNLDKFRMPCMSRYWFYEDGTVTNSITGKEVTLMSTGWYAIFDDKFERVGMQPKEIIQYYKHLMQMFAYKLSGQTETITYRQVK